MSHKIALITGGSRGLGKNTALKLASQGVDIIFTYHTQKDEADAVVAEIQRLGASAIALPLNLADSKTFATFAQQIKVQLKNKWQRENFNFLVNNAGIGIYALFAETTEDQLDQLFNIHFKGTFLLTQTLLPFIVNGGRIINISTGLTRICRPGGAAYASMKGALEISSRYLAQELGPRKIAVNVVAPGAIETDFGGGAVRDNKELNQQIASVTALGRVGVPDDIGGVIASLLSEDHRWINAQRIEVSGGMNI